MYYYSADKTLSLLWLIVAIWYQNSLPFWCEYKKLYKMIYKNSGFSIESYLKIMRIMFSINIAREFFKNVKYQTSSKEQFRLNGY